MVPCRTARAKARAFFSLDTAAAYMPGSASGDGRNETAVFVGRGCRFGLVGGGDEEDDAASSPQADGARGKAGETKARP
jgi:hypothetical protein